MWNSRRLVLAHLWFAFAGFGAALLLGEWQMFIRSPLHAWISDPEWYYRSVTAHGTTMAYVFPTLVAMGFGYFVTEEALKRPLIGLRWAWLGFALVVVGTFMAIIPVALGHASVLYTFYPPLIGSPFYYIGVVLVVVGSWIWVALMSVNLYCWKRDNPGRAGALRDVRDGRRLLSLGLDRGGRGDRIVVPDHPGGAWLAQHDRRRTGARLLLLDAARDRLFLADAGLHRLLHDRSAGDRRPAVQRHDGADRLHSVPCRRDADRHPSHCSRIRRSASGFKFLHSVFTAIVAMPTLLTVFTICASVEIAGRLRGGKGVLGWLTGAAMAQPGHARRRALLRHAGLWRRRRADQHELPAQQLRSITRNGSPAIST